MIQLMFDIEGSIVPEIIEIGIQCPRRIDGIAIGIDIKITTYFPKDRVNLRVERSGSFLFSIRTVSDQIKRQIFIDIV